MDITSLRAPIVYVEVCNIFGEQKKKYILLDIDINHTLNMKFKYYQMVLKFNAKYLHTHWKK